MSLAGIRRYNRSVSFNQGVTGSRPVRPTTKFPNSSLHHLLFEFLNSRRQGTSPRTLEFYEVCLRPFVADYDLTPADISSFLANLNCHNGKNAYYRAIRAFCNWLYKQEYIKDNPIMRVDAPKMTKMLLPSLTYQQVEYLIEQAEVFPTKAGRLLLKMVEEVPDNIYLSREELVREILETAVRSTEPEAKTVVYKIVNLFGERGDYRYRDLLGR